MSSCKTVFDKNFEHIYQSGTEKLDQASDILDELAKKEDQRTINKKLKEVDEKIDLALGSLGTFDDLLNYTFKNFLKEYLRTNEKIEDFEK